MSHQAILLNHADRTRVYQLQGYVFFGSAQALVDRLKEPLLEESPPLCMLLDFTSVTGFDISALDTLVGFVNDAGSIGTRVIIVAPAELPHTELRREFSGDERGNVIWEKDLDHGLERCEEIVLAESSNGTDVGSEGHRARIIDDTLRYLDKLVSFEELIERLRPWLEGREYAAGETVVAAGEKHDGMFLIVEGQVSAFAENGSRLRQHGPGDVLSPQAAIRDHQANMRAIADRLCRVMVLTPVARRVLENDDARLTVELDRYVISSLKP